jgi:hypothetical protein
MRITWKHISNTVAKMFTAFSKLRILFKEMENSMIIVPRKPRKPDYLVP